MDRRRLSICANFVGYTDAMEHMKQPNFEQRRLSDGPTLRPTNSNFYYPGEFSGSESCVLKPKNSSLTMLLDSTNALMRTASTTFQNVFGTSRRASYCGEPDPTIQLSPNGNSGSLFILPNSNESSLSNLSSEEQRRTVTIYDGKVPSASSAPTIPFELMTPFDAITQTIEDPVESFVQIVLEEPDDRPPIFRPVSLSSSSSRRNSPSRHRHRYSTPNSTQENGELSNIDKNLTDTKSLPSAQLSNPSEKKYCQAPKVVEPMDFSFLEPVLRGESAAPPPSRSSSSRSTPPNEPSTNDTRSSQHTITITTDDGAVSSSLSTSFSRLTVPPSID